MFIRITRYVLAVIILAVLAGFVLVLFFPQWILPTLGGVLLRQTPLRHCDAVVVLRGGAEQLRALTAVEIYERGLCDYVIISTSLADNEPLRLRQRGIHIPTGQEVMQSVLEQAGIPPGRIIIGREQPGGGTTGEARRILALARKREFSRLTLVTSWYHTRRCLWIYREMNTEDGPEVDVRAAETDLSGPGDWWRYRYQAVNVLEEVVKWGILLVWPGGDPGFRDDPAAAPARE